MSNVSQNMSGYKISSSFLDDQEGSWYYSKDRSAYLEDTIDAAIRKIEKENKKTGKDLKHLEKMDKKRDKVCDYGAKMMKMKKK